LAFFACYPVLIFILARMPDDISDQGEKIVRYTLSRGRILGENRCDLVLLPSG